jgi:hypothetical protein
LAICRPAIVCAGRPFFVAILSGFFMKNRSTLDTLTAEVAKMEASLDEALAETFPASDPPSMIQPRSGADATDRRLTKRPEPVKKLSLTESARFGPRHRRRMAMPIGW